MSSDTHPDSCPSTRPDSSSTHGSASLRHYGDDVDMSASFALGEAPRGGSGGSGVSIPPPLAQSLRRESSVTNGGSPDTTPLAIGRTRRLRSHADCLMETRGEQRKTSMLPAIDAHGMEHTMPYLAGASRALKRNHSNSSLLPTLPVLALPSASASPSAPYTYAPHAPVELSAGVSPLAGNPSRALIAQKRQRGVCRC